MPDRASIKSKHWNPLLTVMGTCIMTNASADTAAVILLCVGRRRVGFSRTSWDLGLRLRVFPGSLETFRRLPAGLTLMLSRQASSS